MLPRIALTLFTVMFADLIGNKHFKEVDVDVRMAAKSGTQLINIVISCGDAMYNGIQLQDLLEIAARMGCFLLKSILKLLFA